jgi:hypothetical protein
VTGSDPQQRDRGALGATPPLLPVAQRMDLSRWPPGSSRIGAMLRAYAALLASILRSAAALLRSRQDQAIVELALRH